MAVPPRVGGTTTPSHYHRLGLTAGWLFLLGGFFRWWELTLKLPALLVWTALFVFLFAGTAALVHGPALRDRKHPAWKRSAVWLGFVLLTLLAVAIVPAVQIRGVPVRTVVFAGVLDAILPLWIAVSATMLLWDGWARIAVVASLPVILAVSMWFFVVRMPGASFRGALDPLTAEQEDRRRALEHHVRVLSAEIGERNDGTYAALEAARVYLDSVLTDIGYEVAVHEYEFAGQRFRNLEVTVSGGSRADEIVLVGAHYDTAEDAPGADDNASGAAGVLELARTFRTARPDRTIRFVLFANEEPPFFSTEWMGSRVYATHARARGDRIVGVLSLETIAYYSDEPGSQRYPPPFNFFYPDRGDFIGFVGNLGSGRLVRRAIATFRREARFPSEGAASPGWIPGVSWSDHASFWPHGIPAIMITDTAPFRNPFYHTIHDTIDKLDFGRMVRVVDGVAAVVRDLAIDTD